MTDSIPPPIRGRRRWLLLGALCVALAAVAVASLVLVRQHKSGDALQAGESRVLAEMAREKIVARPLSPSAAAGDTLISRREALSIARSDSPFVRGPAAAAWLVSFTDNSYGPEVTPTPGGPGVVEDPKWEDDPAYVVVFNDVTTPQFGPSGGSYRSALISIVDARTGRLLESFTAPVGVPTPNARGPAQ